MVVQKLYGPEITVYATIFWWLTLDLEKILIVKHSKENRNEREFRC